MILSLLDTEAEVAQTMAFVVSSEGLGAFRAALQAVLERGDARPMLALAASTERPDVKVQLDAAQVRRWCAQATEAATALKLDPNLATLEAWLAGKTTVEVFADRFMPVAQTVANLNGWQSLAEVSALIATNRIAVLLEGLRQLDDEPEVFDEVEPVHQLDWVRTLTFRDASGAVFDTVQDKRNDAVVGVPATDFEFAPIDVFERVRAQSRGWDTLERLIGPFAPSQGPGPFLPVPDDTQSFESAISKRLPLFEGVNEPLMQGSFLDGEALARAAASLKTAQPRRDWHDTPIDDHDWKALVAKHWERCRRRFERCLTDAAKARQAVVFLPSERSHPFWLEGGWPPVVKR